MKPYQFLALLWAVMIQDELPLRVNGDPIGFVLNSAVGIFIIGVMAYEFWRLWRPVIAATPSEGSGG